MSPRSVWTSEACRNCGNTAAGRYCPGCGQRKGVVKVSLRRMLADVLEDQLSINATLPRTLVGILVRPGRLTAEYLDGRIASYIPPFRLYLAASVLFFLVLSIGSRADEIRVALEAAGDTTVSRVALDEAGAAVRAALDSVGEATGRAAGRVPADSAPAAREAGGPGSRLFFGVHLTPGEPGDSVPWTERVVVNTGLHQLDAVVQARIRELGALPAEEALARVVNATLERIPTAMFVLLPVFALLLKLLYIRRDRYYMEHFVFALHYHAFAFLAFTLMLALQGTPLRGVLGLWLILYLWLALKRVYGQGFVWTTGKWLALSWGYMLILAVGLLATAVAAILML